MIIGKQWHGSIFSFGNLYHLFYSVRSATIAIFNSHLELICLLAIDIALKSSFHLSLTIRSMIAFSTASIDLSTDRFLTTWHRFRFSTLSKTMLPFPLLMMMIMMNVYNCFIIFPRARSKRFLIAVIYRRQILYDSVNKCSSDIYHLKLMWKTRSKSVTWPVDFNSMRLSATEMIRHKFGYVLVAVFWRSLFNVPSPLADVSPRNSSA